MEDSSGNNRLDYKGLQELAHARNIRLVEARGLENKCGVRFKKDGEDWIAIHHELPESDKVRALGYLLENYPEESQSETESPSGASPGPQTVLVASLQC
jgi:hypothetical protein